MADELTIVNGVASDFGSRTAENDGISKGDGDLTIENDGKIPELNRMIETVEQEKSELVSANEKTKEKIKLLMDEIEGLKINDVEMRERMLELLRENERFVEDKKALQVVTVRAAELETEVSRLQDDLISSISESEETMVELSQLKNEYEKLKQKTEETDLKVEDLEKEKASLLERIGREADELKKSKTESEIRVRDLEADLSVMESAKVNIAEKDGEILRLQKQKKESETLISSLNEALKDLRQEFKSMEEKALRLENELDESQKMVSELKEKNLMTNNLGGSKSAEKGLKSLKLHWPAVLASAGTVAAAAAAAVLYIRYSKRR